MGLSFCAKRLLARHGDHAARPLSPLEQCAPQLGAPAPCTNPPLGAPEPCADPPLGVLEPCATPPLGALEAPPLGALAPCAAPPLGALGRALGSADDMRLLNALALAPKAGLPLHCRDQWAPLAPLAPQVQGYDVGSSLAGCEGPLDGGPPLGALGSAVDPLDAFEQRWTPQRGTLVPVSTEIVEPVQAHPHPLVSKDMNGTVWKSPKGRGDLPQMLNNWAPLEDSNASLSSSVGDFVWRGCIGAWA